MTVNHPPVTIMPYVIFVIVAQDYGAASMRIIRGEGDSSRSRPARRRCLRSGEAIAESIGICVS
jgi:hypothetical protein